MSLYTKIVDVDESLSFDDENENVEEYKNRVLNHFDAIEDDEEFEALDEEIREWVDGAVDIAKANKTSKRKKALPDIEGLEEPSDDDEDGEEESDSTDDDDIADYGDEDEDEAETVTKAKPGRKKVTDDKPVKAKAVKEKAAKAKPAKAKKEPKPKKEPKGRDATANRYYRGFVLLAENPTISTEAEMVAAAAKHGWEYSEVTVKYMLEAAVAAKLCISTEWPKAHTEIFGK